jgi:NitT/TauT family transport system permease protein
MLPGLLIGTSIGVLLGYGISKSPLIEELLTPIIVAFQATPIVAYAPLLVIWFGSGQTSKIITCAVIVFFPTMMNTMIGIRNVPHGLRDVLRSLRATRWQMLIKLEIPAALPVIFAGLKTSATLAVIGAVVGEFVSAGHGLGYLVTAARYDYNTPLVYVTILTMTALALILYWSVSVLAWYLLAWQRRGN